MTDVTCEPRPPDWPRSRSVMFSCDFLCRSICVRCDQCPCSVPGSDSPCNLLESDLLLLERPEGVLLIREHKNFRKGGVMLQNRMCAILSGHRTAVAENCLVSAETPRSQSGCLQQIELAAPNVGITPNRQVRRSEKLSRSGSSLLRSRRGLVLEAAVSARIPRATACLSPDT
jgi:hypothetical protein